MFSTALIFLEQEARSPTDLEAEGSEQTSRIDLALDIFENLDADNFDALQLRVADLSLFRTFQLSRRFEHEHEW